MPTIKALRWVGSAKKDFQGMPDIIQDVFGYALYLAQSGSRHNRAKPLSGFGDASVVEIVASDHGNAYRAVYTVRYVTAIFVLHCFQKKSTRNIETPKREMDLVRTRLLLASAMERSS